MNETDDAILEFYSELDVPGDEPLELTPQVVHRHLVEKLGVLDRDSTTISRRMKNLSERGLLERPKPDSALYLLTQKGRDYLSGELDAEELIIEE